MSIIKFNKTMNKNTYGPVKKESDVIDFKAEKEIPEFEPVTEEPVIGYAWPMGQFIITNIPGMGHYATLIIKEQR